jgi:uncharacterized membrane protein
MLSTSAEWPLNGGALWFLFLTQQDWAMFHALQSRMTVTVPTLVKLEDGAEQWLL